jgi:hypothetical protein
LLVVLARLQESKAQIYLGCLEFSGVKVALNVGSEGSAFWRRIGVLKKVDARDVLWAS